MAEVDAEAEIRVGYYETVTPESADGPARSGIIVTGTLDVSAERATGVGSSGTVAGSFTVDAHTVHDGESGDAESFVTVTLQGSLSTGVVAEAVDRLGPDGVEWDATVEQGGVVTVEITMPSDDPAAVLLEVVPALISGELPGLDDADVTITVDGTVATVTSEFEVDAGVVEVEVDVTSSRRENVVTYRKFPGGEFYSQDELDEAIDEQLGVEPEPQRTPEEQLLAGTDPDLYVFDAAGEVVGIDYGVGGLIGLDELGAAGTGGEAGAAGEGSATPFLDQVAALDDQPGVATPDSAADDEPAPGSGVVAPEVVAEQNAAATLGPEDVLFDGAGEPIGVNTGTDLVRIGQGAELAVDDSGTPVGIRVEDSLIRLDDGDTEPEPDDNDDTDSGAPSDPLVYEDGELVAVHTEYGVPPVPAGAEVIEDSDGDPAAVATGDGFYVTTPGNSIVYDDDTYEPIAVDTGDELIRLDNPDDDDPDGDEEAA